MNAYKKATFFERLAAFIIDSIILIVLYMLLSNILKLSEEFNILEYLIAPLYGSLFVWRAGATPGKMLLRLKVVTASYKKVGLGHALLRETIGKWIYGLILSLGYLWMLIDKNNQTWHDKIANTLVVKLDKSGKLIPAGGSETVAKSRKIMFWVILLLNPISLATYFLFIYLFLFRPFQIAGQAMYPTLQEKEYYLTNVIGVKINPPQRNELIIFGSPDYPEKKFIKRVIGVAGDRIMLKDGNVYLNGQLLDESSYLPQDVRTYGGSFIREAQEITVPQNSYFLLGDNRPFSSDSREWGFVPKENTISKVMFCYWNCHKK
jgi:signal peptidase I